MRRAVVALVAAAAAILGGSAPLAQEGPPQVLVFRIEGTTFSRFVNQPPLSAVASFGGIAMLRGPDPSIAAIDALEAAGVQIVDVPGAPSPQLPISDVLEGFDGELFVVVVGLSAPGGVLAEGPDALLLARGSTGNLLGIYSDVPLSTLTSDSTRRHGIVTPADIVATVEQVARVDVPGVNGGSLIRVVATEPPVGLYDKYLQYKELSAPIQGAVGIWELVVGGLALWAMAGRGSWRLPLGAALSLPVLFLALLLVGHLPSLSYPSVLPVLVGATAVAGVLLLRVADRSGVGVALAWAGGAALAGLVVESLVGWTAAFAPMLGGSQLDGARFFGLPNAFLGLALGGAVLVAARIRSTIACASLLAAVGLWAGAPWSGADIGGAITLFAAAGIWWGLRGERGWLRTAAATATCIVIGVAVVVLAHRELTDAPTHISRFVETSGPADFVEKAIDRLGIGLRLLRDQPAALIPVVGTLIGLFVIVRRPPSALRSGFRLEPSSRPAALTILAGSVVAYLANDTGAAALGLGFGTAMVCLFAVSLAAAGEKMDA